MKTFQTAILILFSLFSIMCSIETVGESHSPYIVEVVEYVYGVGQHAQSVSDGEEENLIGATSKYVRLGGWGGYIIGRFDHSVINQEGNHNGYDLAVYPQGGAGNEPAVIYVMKDTNENDLADDTWYQIKGSEYDEKHIVTLTYHKNENLEGSITYTMGDISGTLTASEQYNGPSALWWWNSYDERLNQTLDSVTIGEDETGLYASFTGVMLPDSKEYSDGMWEDVSDTFLWGYGENYSGEDYHSVPFSTSQKTANLIDISDAVDDKGEEVYLPSIDFIKIQTGVFQVCGDLNELSSEISAVSDISLLGDEWEID